MYKLVKLVTYINMNVKMDDASMNDEVRFFLFVDDRATHHHHQRTIGFVE